MSEQSSASEHLARLSATVDASVFFGGREMSTLLNALPALAAVVAAAEHVVEEIETNVFFMATGSEADGLAIQHIVEAKNLLSDSLAKVAAALNQETKPCS